MVEGSALAIRRFFCLAHGRDGRPRLDPTAILTPGGNSICKTVDATEPSPPIGPSTRTTAAQTRYEGRSGGLSATPARKSTWSSSFATQGVPLTRVAFPARYLSRRSESTDWSAARSTLIPHTGRRYTSKCSLLQMIWVGLPRSPKLRQRVSAPHRGSSCDSEWETPVPHRRRARMQLDSLPPWAGGEGSPPEPPASADDPGGSPAIQVRFSRFRGTVQQGPVRRQETQIVQSWLDLRDLLP